MGVVRGRVVSDGNARRIVSETGASKLLLVASGGCTALSLAAWFPRLELTLVDPNPAQLQLVGSKIDLLRAERSERLLRRFNVGDGSASGLSESGRFEALF